TELLVSNPTLPERRSLSTTRHGIFLLHVLPKGFHRIRHCGLLAGSARKASLALARELLNVAAPADDDTTDEPDNFRPPCPCCGGRMIVIEVFERWRQPRGPPHGSPSTGSSTP
ncbi:transposase, partial [Mesorhizobium sp. M0833]|uniref:transposase n=1 Tax=Mesorhizobium sp. M0833 TaxID=2957009 RepID=UPI0033358B12